MSKTHTIPRRSMLRASALGLVSLPVVGIAGSHLQSQENAPHGSYPSIDPEIISEVVGKSHFDLDRVKELVEVRPELARATWDWGFGDFESAIGAASHVGRRDIVEYLLQQGARPTLFTYAMLGAHDIVKSMVEYTPGIQRSLGPHGISLLRHAKVGLRMEDSMTDEQIQQCEQLISFLERLGDADTPTYEEVPEDQKSRYLGDYRYGDQDHQGFSVKLNMRKMLSLGRIGAFGGALYKIGDNEFFYNGAPSTTVSFQFEGEQVVSLTIKEPGRELVAQKLS